jgi:hypothetical protein
MRNIPHASSRHMFYFLEVRKSHWRCPPWPRLRAARLTLNVPFADRFLPEGERQPRTNRTLLAARCRVPLLLPAQN